MASLTQLSYALAVQKHQHFHRAAKACHVSQPTLSAQLAKLEEELEVKLFDRTRKPVQATQDGKRLLDQFAEVIRQYDRIGELVHEMQGIVAGPYRLGIIPTMAPYFLPRILPGFVAAYPEVEVLVEEITTNEIIGRLLDETLDGGILATPLREPRIREFPLCREDFVIFHSAQVEMATDRQGRVRIGHLPLEQLIVMREGHCLRAQTLDLCELSDAAPQKQNFSIAAGSLATLCNMVTQGPFFTILPALAAEELRAQGQGELIKEIAGSVPYREVGLVAHRTQVRKAVRDALVQHARTVLKPTQKTRRRHQAEPIPPR